MFLPQNKKTQAHGFQKPVSKTGHACNAQGMTQTLTQGVTHARSPDVVSSRQQGASKTPSARRRGAKSAGPYLQRRGQIFYFRKRLPKPLAERVKRAFLCFSLQTHVVSEAMIRVGRVLAALELAETQMTQLAEITTLTSA